TFQLANVGANALRDEERDLFRQIHFAAGGLTHQDGYAGLELRRLDRHGEPPAETRFQPLLEAFDLLRIPVTRKDYLLLPLVKSVERMEELFLRAILVREKLNVVDQERIERAIRRFEFVDRVLPERLHHVADETLRVHISYARLRVSSTNHVSDGVHQMRLAET